MYMHGEYVRVTLFDYGIWRNIMQLPSVLSATVLNISKIVLTFKNNLYNFII